jgi:hypothetical protein
MRVLFMTRIRCLTSGATYVTHGDSFVLEKSSAVAFVRAWESPRKTGLFETQSWVLSATVPHACDAQGCFASSRETWARVARLLAAREALVPRLGDDLSRLIVALVRASM